LIDRADKAFEQYRNVSPVGKREFEMVIQEMNELTQPDSGIQQQHELVFEAVPANGLEKWFSGLQNACIDQA